MALKPKRLQPGNTLGVAATASYFDRRIVKRGAKVLESLGFQIYLPDEIYEKESYLAGSDKLRAATLNRLFSMKNIDGIICARGGYGSMRILPLLDYDLIQKNPKLFIGFSDVTAILEVLYQRCRLATIHGPTLTTLASSDQSTKDALFRLITSKSKLEWLPDDGVTILPGVSSGTLLGGNLTTICHLLATPFSPQFQGSILFLEDRGEATYRIDRMLTQMLMSGCLDEIVGLVLGAFEDCGSIDKLYNLIYDLFRHMNIPILAGFSLGHISTNLPIPHGLIATLDSNRHLLSISEPAVED